MSEKSKKEYLELYPADKYFAEDVSGLANYYKIKDRSGEQSELKSAERFECKDNIYQQTEKIKHKEKTAKIICCGDILLEDLMYKACKIEDNQFDFSSVFKHMKPILKDSDLTIANLETLFVKEFPYTGELIKIKDIDRDKYNNNAPDQFLNEIVDSGFDLLTLANNHNLDWGKLGISETIRKLNQRNIIHTGLFENESQDRTLVVDVNGIKLGILAYSTWFNSNEHRITDLGKKVIINAYSLQRLKDDVSTLKKAGAEYIISFIHWGVDAEYKLNASKSQRKTAEELANNGIDCIIGSHPHAPQEIEFIDNKAGKKIPVVYSLGNFATSDRNLVARDNFVVTLNLGKNNKEIVNDLEFLPCHIFEEFSGEKFSIVPTTIKNSKINKESIAVLKNIDKKLSALANKAFNKYGNAEWTYKKICSALGIEAKETINKSYPFIHFADKTTKNSVAILTPFSSKIDYIPSEKIVLEKLEIAEKKGADLFISPYPLDDKYPHIVYPKPIEAVAKLSSYFMEQFPELKTIAITGSIGKTTLTQFIIDVLKPHFNTYHSTGSANNVRYIFGNIQNLKSEHEVYVQETQEGPPQGCGSTLSQMINPMFVVVSKVSEAHMNEFKTLENVAKSVFGLQDYMNPEGAIITNADDPYQENQKTIAKRIRYGINNNDSDYLATDIKYVKDGTKFKLHYEDKILDIKIHLYGQHNIYNALAAFAAGKLYGLDDQKIVKSLHDYRTSGIRQNLVKIDNKNFYIDCYNASRESIVGALKTIDSIENKNPNNKKIAVLGDVLELGDITEKEHKKIGEAVTNSKLDTCIFFGENMKYAYEKALELKAFKDDDYFWTDNDEQLIELIKATVKDEDLVLFKGSHGMKLELIIDKIYGTYYNEPFRNYDLESKKLTKDNLSFIDYVDHVNISGGTINAEEPKFPAEINGKKITNVDRGAFTRNSKIKKLVIPNGYKTIKYCGFFRNDNLEEIIIPSTMRRIEVSAFSNCKKLKKLTLYEGLYFIGKRAFASCDSLEKVTLPYSVNEMDGNIFEGIRSIEVSVYRDSPAHKILAKRNYPNINLKLI